jgi:hypothetical protein
MKIPKRVGLNRLPSGKPLRIGVNLSEPKRGCDVLLREDVFSRRARVDFF